MTQGSTAVYRQDGAFWIPGPEAKGPFPGQHGGAFGAVLATTMERWAAANDAGRAIQFSMHMPRPTPMAALRTTLEIVQSGKRLSLLRAELFAEDRRTALATGVFVRPAAVPALAEPEAEPRDPMQSQPYTMPLLRPPPWFLDTVEMRRAADGTFWMRSTMPVVEPFTPLARIAAHADWMSGVSRPDGFETPQVGNVPNADLSIHLSREPVGEWLGLKGTPNWRGDGIGVTTAALRDARGPIGQAAQSLVLLPL